MIFCRACILSGDKVGTGGSNPSFTATILRKTLLISVLEMVGHLLNEILPIVLEVRQSQRDYNIIT